MAAGVIIYCLIHIVCCLSSQPLLTQLRAIFDLIINFENIQETMYANALEELDRRQAIVRTVDTRTEQVSQPLTAWNIYIQR